ncbi:complex 1 LYR protein [Diplogelasinospora grovesii]|uniref:LYR motif-containing protein 2 n=1 Tax=Diplogelasinospora grovesii TaxID=303347 RepID=A0AAN6MW25_9PEZI|nr:complex 1 LYR protein [Diplogelasinospora grovesii]
MLSTLPGSWHCVRRYAAATGGPRSSSRLGPTLSLDHFLQRGRALSLYRTILRSTRRIRDPATRAETRRFAREEFERHRQVTDIGHIRYLLSTGKTEWESMERYIDGL